MSRPPASNSSSSRSSGRAAIPPAPARAQIPPPAASSKAPIPPPAKSPRSSSSSSASSSSSSSSKRKAITSSDDGWMVVTPSAEPSTGTQRPQSLCSHGSDRTLIESINLSFSLALSFGGSWLVLEVRQEYEELEALMKKWELVNRHKPFSKSFLLILGCTSSGKVRRHASLAWSDTCGCSLSRALSCSIEIRLGNAWLMAGSIGVELVRQPLLWHRRQEGRRRAGRHCTLSSRCLSLSLSHRNPPAGIGFGWVWFGLVLRSTLR